MNTNINRIYEFQTVYENMLKKHESNLDVLKKNLKCLEKDIQVLNTKYSDDRMTISNEFKQKIDDQIKIYNENIKELDTLNNISFVSNDKLKKEFLTNHIIGSDEQNVLDRIRYLKGNLISDKKSIIEKKIKLLKTKFNDTTTNNLYSSNPEQELKNIKKSFFDTLSSLYDSNNELNSIHEKIFKEYVKNLEKDNEILIKNKEIVKLNYENEIKELEKSKKQKLDELGKKYEDKIAAKNLDIKKLKQKIEEISNDQTIEKKNFLNNVKNKIDTYFREPNYYVGEDLNFDNVIDVPRKFSIGCIYQETESLQLLEDIYGQSKQKLYESINIDISNSQNIIIKQHDQENDDVLCQVICGLILKNLESFPLGSLSLTIIDNYNDRCFSTICNGFQQASSEHARSIIKYDLIHRTENAVRTLENFSEIIGRINRKLNNECPDLLSLIENDNTEPFNLIVIKKGFNELINRSEALNALVSITRNKQCGIRFIIVDDFDSNTNSRNNENNLSQLESSSIIINFDSGKFTINNEFATISQIKDNDNVKWRSLLETEIGQMAQYLDNRVKNVVTYDELDINNVTPDEVIEIPIGKCAGNTYNLFFGCSGDKTNVGCMILGKPGTGKSSIFHSIVINGSRKYSPEDLQFWLLDFKAEASSSKYINANIPHISKIALNGKPEDALNLLRLLSAEANRRQRLHNSVGVSDISRYNNYVKNNINSSHKHMPRIIVMIDEAQDLIPSGMDYENHNYSEEIKGLISDLVNKCRSRGIHIVMCAQNFANGKAYSLISSFVIQTKIRISFAIEPGLADTLGLAFKNNKVEISNLKDLTAMVSVDGGNDHLDKIKIAVSKERDNFEPYFNQIRGTFESEVRYNTRLIGGILKLTPNSFVMDMQKNYLDLMCDTSRNIIDMNNFDLIIGEDYYLQNPIKLRYNDNSNCGCTIIGNNTLFGTSILLSLLYGSLCAGFSCYAYDGDIRENTFKKVVQDNEKVRHFDRLDSLLTNVTNEIQRRRCQLQDNENCILTPLMVFLNGLCSFNRDELLEQHDTNDSINPAPQTTSEGIRCPNTNRSPNTNQRITLLNMLTNLVKIGHNVRVYINFSIPDVSTRYGEIFKSNNIIACSEIQSYEQMNIRNMNRIIFDLNQISSLLYPTNHPFEGNKLNPEDHPYAIYINSGKSYRFKPIIWKDEYINKFRG